MLTFWMWICVMRDRATHMAYSCKHRKHFEMYNRTIDFQLQHTSMLFPFNELNYDDDEKKSALFFCSFFLCCSASFEA